MSNVEFESSVIFYDKLSVHYGEDKAKCFIR